MFGNAHDILYASKSRTASLMIKGDYTKYLDDTLKALSAWKESWDSLEVSAHLRCCLDLMFEYLRLYVSAFAFQAVLSRTNRPCSSRESSVVPKPFAHSIMASPDARHIYEAVEAATALLTIVATRIDPMRYLRYMPVRYYL